ncbi:hypothetical protein OFM39_35825, partial [Escherichia coli]|nr:hypothetical protein [Escherichia coli]
FTNWKKKKKLGFEDLRDGIAYMIRVSLLELLVEPVLNQHEIVIGFRQKLQQTVRCFVMVILCETPH